MNEETNAGTTVGTAPTPEVQAGNSNGGLAQTNATAGVQPTGQPNERMYTKAQVTDLMKRRVERSHQSFFKRYGVKDLNGLDELFTKTKSYDDMRNSYGELELRNKEYEQKIAFLENNIEPSRYNDIKAYFKGNDIAFSTDALIEAIKTHPEWVRQSNPTPQTTIQSMGVEQTKPAGVDEREIASKIFGVKL